AEARTQWVTDIKGRTYIVAEGDRVEIHEMDKRSIFDEDVDGTSRRTRFTLPALQPGAVVEYRYKILSTDPAYFPDWTFQTSEPVLWSEFRAEVPEIYRYVWVMQGARAQDVAEQEPYVRQMRWTIDLRSENAIERSYQMAYASAQVQGIKYRWVMQDVPALRREPYMTTPDDFRAKVRFELAEIGRPSTPMVRVTIGSETVNVPVTQVPVTKVMTSWDALAKQLMAFPRFGRQIGDHRAIRDQARAIVGGMADPAQKMQALYDYVRTTVVWTGKRGVLLEENLDDVLAAHRGNSPEIALLLVSMLREAGLEAHPVLISTRSHGQVLSLYPLLSQFDDVLAHVTIDGVDHLLDATDPLRPYTLLPDEALNGKGFLVRHPNPSWVAITPADQYRHQRFINGALDAAGQLTGMIQTSDGGYSALEHRRALGGADTPNAFARDILLDGLDGALVDSCTVRNEDAVDEDLKTEAVFTVPAFAQVAGSFIYFNPTPLGRLRANPLRLPERTFPVDLVYPRQQVYSVLLQLPEGYAVQETPRNVRIRLPDDGAMYQRLIDVQADVLMVQYQMVIRQSLFEPERYEEIRSFFEQLVATEAEQVVLKRVTDPDNEME
ncbi:MAG: DUF3857 and transglutaminase domain-containing protein, partial [Gemmatimonadota bacterium]|nr:DUF3857 and transglutaminase domain-containing protein [Gemmatimonadota bacterium]